jgi:hypothetical protein
MRISEDKDVKHNDVWKKIKEEAKRGEGLWDTSEMWDHN